MQQHLRFKREFNEMSVRFVVLFVLAGSVTVFLMRASQVRQMSDLLLVAPISVVLTLSVIAFFQLRRGRVEQALWLLLAGSSITMLGATFVFNFADTMHFWLVHATLLVCAAGVFPAERVRQLMAGTSVLVAACFIPNALGLNIGRDYGVFNSGLFGVTCVGLLLALVGLQGIRASAMFEKTVVDLASSADRLARVVEEQAVTNQQLQESEERYRLLLEHTPVALVRYDSDFRLVYSNPRLVALFDLQPESLPTLRLDALASAGMMRLLQDALNGQGGQFESLHVNATNGRQWWMDMTCTPVKDSNGRVVGGVVAFRDATERRKRELELSLTRDQAQKASDAKNRFLAMMSHEIRTPMNGVYGNAQLLTDPRLPDAKRDALVTTILKSSKSLMTLLDDILDTSKIEAGLIELVEKRFEPHLLLRDTTDLFQEVARAKGLSLYCAWQGEDPGYLKGDSARLRQMISNLIGNAIKYTPSGFIQVQGELLSQQAGGAVLKFSVTDSGIGIARETQAALFQPFSRAKDKVTQSIEGTGLGLSIVRQLATLMRGDAGVVSEPGHGSTFWFIVNLALDERDPWDDGSDDDDDADDFVPVAISKPALKIGADKKEEMKILLVEDNATNAQLVQDMLELEGFTVHHALNGQEALDALFVRKVDVDAVLMDCRMPVMDGYECTQRIREHEAAHADLPKLPIIALTANVFDDDRNRCLQVGMDDFLRKPVDLGELIKTLQKYAA